MAYLDEAASFRNVAYVADKEVIRLESFVTELEDFVPKVALLLLF